MQAGLLGSFTFLIRRTCGELAKSRGEEWVSRGVTAHGLCNLLRVLKASLCLWLLQFPLCKDLSGNWFSVVLTV